MKHKPLLQLGQDTVSWGLLPQSENMDTGVFSTTPLSTIPKGSVVFLFALLSSQQHINLWPKARANNTQVAASRMIKITRFCLVLPTCRSRAHCVTILRMGKLRHVMVQ